MRLALKAHSEFYMVLGLFIAWRLMSLLLMTPSSPFTASHSDYQYYYEVGKLTGAGYYPYINYWFEYPPVFTYIAIGVYKLTEWAHRDYAYFSQILALTLLPFEVLTLTCLYLIARRLYNLVTAVRLCWIYSALLLPAFFWQYSFDTMVAGLTLLAFYFLLSEKRNASAIVLGFAIGTKLVPAFLLGTVWRFALKWRQALIYTGIVVGTVALIFGYFFWRSPVFTLASFESLMTVSSWETIWALLDGNYAYGDVGVLARHLDPAQALIPLYNGPTVPGWLTALIFGGIFLYLYSRPFDRKNPRHLLLFTGMTLMLFHLWSKGWSPQWITLLLPFLLLLYPNGRGVLFVLVLSFVNLLDWPLAFAFQNNLLYVFGIVMRTLLFILILLDLYSRFKAGVAAGQMEPSQVPVTRTSLS